MRSAHLPVPGTPGWKVRLERHLSDGFFDAVVFRDDQGDFARVDERAVPVIRDLLASVARAPRPTRTVVFSAVVRDAAELLQSYADAAALRTLVRILEEAERLCLRVGDSGDVSPGASTIVRALGTGYPSPYVLELDLRASCEICAPQSERVQGIRCPEHGPRGGRP